jgi:V8-like Glu-specific endopeptidase
MKTRTWILESQNVTTTFNTLWCHPFQTDNRQEHAHRQEHDLFHTNTITMQKPTTATYNDREMRDQSNITILHSYRQYHTSRKMILVSPLLVLLFSCCCEVTDARTRRRAAYSAQPAARSLVVYGADDRQQENGPRVSDAMRAIGASTVMLVHKIDLELNEDGGAYVLASGVLSYTERYGDAQCNGDPWPYPEDLLPGFCSGALIADQHVATAGHCIPDAATCEDTYMVFGATVDQVATRSFPASSVYACSRIHTGIFQPTVDDDDVETRRLYLQNKITRPDYLFLDFAVVEIDRPVPPETATPVAVRTKSRVNMSDEVFVVGHPDGSPRKYTASSVNFVGPYVPSGGYYWAAPFETFQGNSGSGVFDMETGELVGIHVVGTSDYEEEELCISNRLCPDQGPNGNPLNDSAFIERISALDDDGEFLNALGEYSNSCSGEWQEGSTVLSAALVDIRGCTSDDDCRNGGMCAGDRCECPNGYFGADCSQAKSRALCNGVGENTGYLLCTCPPGTAPPLCQVCSAEESLLEDGCYDEDSDLIDGCACDDSCASCGYFSDPVNADDCVSCKAGGRLNVVFVDGTGECEYGSDVVESVCEENLMPINRCGETKCLAKPFFSNQEECAALLDQSASCDSAVVDYPEANVCGESDSTEMLELFQCPSTTEDSGSTRILIQFVAATMFSCLLMAL